MASDAEMAKKYAETYVPPVDHVRRGYAELDEEHRRTFSPKLELDDHQVFPADLSSLHPLVKFAYNDRVSFVNDDHDEMFLRFLLETPIDQLTRAIDLTSPTHVSTTFKFTWAQRVMIMVLALGPYSRTAHAFLPSGVVRFLRMQTEIRQIPRLDVSITLEEGLPRFQFINSDPGTGKTAMSLVAAAALLTGDPWRAVCQTRQARNQGEMMVHADALVPTVVVAASTTTYASFIQTIKEAVPFLNAWKSTKFRVVENHATFRLSDAGQTPTFVILAAKDFYGFMRSNVGTAFAGVVCDEWTGIGSNGQQTNQMLAEGQFLWVLNATPSQLVNKRYERSSSIVHKFLGACPPSRGRGLASVIRHGDMGTALDLMRYMCRVNVSATCLIMRHAVRASLEQYMPLGIDECTFRCAYATLSAYLVHGDVDLVPLNFLDVVEKALAKFYQFATDESKNGLRMLLRYQQEGAGHKRPAHDVGAIDIKAVANYIGQMENTAPQDWADQRCKEAYKGALAQQHRVSERLLAYHSDSCPICYTSNITPIVMSCCGYAMCGACSKKLRANSCPNCRNRFCAFEFERVPRKQPNRNHETYASPLEAVQALVQDGVSQADAMRATLDAFQRTGLKRIVVAVNFGSEVGLEVDEFGDCGYNVVRADLLLRDGAKNAAWNAEIDRFIRATEPTIFLIYSKIRVALAGTDGLKNADAIVIAGAPDQAILAQVRGRFNRPGTVSRKHRVVIVQLRMNGSL